MYVLLCETVDCWLLRELKNVEIIELIVYVFIAPIQKTDEL